jgi:hypothetical protein
MYEADKVFKKAITVFVVYPDSAFDGDWNRYAGLHRGNTVGDKFRFRHQARADTALLHPVARASDVKVYLLVTRIFDLYGASSQFLRVATSQLNRYRFILPMSEKMRRIAMNQCAANDHFTV